MKNISHRDNLKAKRNLYIKYKLGHSLTSILKEIFAYSDINITDINSCGNTLYC